MPGQLFAFAPGSRLPPKRVERYFTLVKAGNLDLAQLPGKEEMQAPLTPPPGTKASKKVDLDQVMAM